jgi:hypothetical protein
MPFTASRKERAIALASSRITFYMVGDRKVVSVNISSSDSAVLRSAHAAIAALDLIDSVVSGGEGDRRRSYYVTQRGRHRLPPNETDVRGAINRAVRNL